MSNYNGLSDRYIVITNHPTINRPCSIADRDIHINILDHSNVIPICEVTGIQGERYCIGWSKSRYSGSGDCCENYSYFDLGYCGHGLARYGSLSSVATLLKRNFAIADSLHTPPSISDRTDHH
jgi:hypothetical protein